ncbi:hypothetical protein [Actinophytocola sp. KF-1]
MVDTHEAKRIQQTNYERQALASAQGWGFAQDAPELLDKWPLKPFTEIGDKRMAFGVVSGMVGGVAFTAFDYHRRPRVTNYKSLGVTTMSIDTILIDTVWVLTLPATLPKFQVFDSAEPNFDKEGAVPPQTADAKVNRSYLLVDTDPGVAVQLLTPAVAALMKQYKLHNWATWGDQLLCVKHPIFGRVKPEELSAKVAELGQLIGVLPPHMWGTGGAAPQPAPPQPAQPQPAQSYPQQPVAQPYPQQGYPPQPYPQQPQYQQPQYQQPYPHQGYPPQPYYPQQPYPPQPYPPQPYPPQPYYPAQPGYPPQGWR